jgi:hypothetical protein
MTRSPVLASALVALVSVPGFLVGQKLHHHEDQLSVLLLLPLLLMVVLVASALMRQSD